MKRLLLQLLALAPLPLVAAAIYYTSGPPPSAPPLAHKGGVAGAAASAKGAPAVTLPPTLKSGWKLKGPVVRYNEKTLFDRINGAAPAYIRAGFVALYGAEYGKPGFKEPVIIDAYDMGTPLQGLGMYATERDSSYTFIEGVGLEAYLASGSLNFWHGRFYVKMAGYEEGEAMDRGLKELALGLARALPKAGDMAQVMAPLSRLPQQGRVPHSGGFSRPALADIKGLQGAFYADYKAGEDAKYRLFVVPTADAATAAKRFAQAKAYFAGDGARVTTPEAAKRPTMLVQGDGMATFVVQAGQLLAGGVDLDLKLLEQARTALGQALDGETK